MSTATLSDLKPSVIAGMNLTELDRKARLDRGNPNSTFVLFRVYPRIYSEPPAQYGTHLYNIVMRFCVYRSIALVDNHLSGWRDWWWLVSTSG